MPVDAITVGAGTLALGETGTLTNLESQVTSCRVVPAVEVGDAINVLSGEQAPGDRSESWTLKGTILQDFGRATGEDLTEWLFTHRGETMPFTFTPSTSRGKAVTGSLTVEAIEIGGDVKTKPTSDFEWQLVGEPTITAPAPLMGGLSTSTVDAGPLSGSTDAPPRPRKRPTTSTVDAGPLSTPDK